MTRFSIDPSRKVLSLTLLALALASLPASAFAGGAVLMSGFTDAGFQADLTHVYRTLRAAGYTPEGIHVLYHTGEDLDLDGDGNPDVDDGANKTDIAEAFDALGGQLSPGDVVVFFATGHGNTLNKDGNYYPSGLVYTPGWADEFWDYELATEFRDLETAVGGTLRKICLIVPCRSGGFVVDTEWSEVDDLNDLASISVSTSVKYTQDSEYFDYGYPMTYWWTSGLQGADWDGNAVNADTNADGYVSLAEAFAFADTKSKTSEHTPQHVSKGCLLDHFTALNGMFFDLPVLAITMTCCPPGGPHPWERHDCFGLGMGLVTVSGGSLAPQGTSTATIEATARLVNGGTAVSEPGVLRYYYRAPTLGLGFYDTGWQPVATRTLPAVAPGDTLEMPPVPFSVPDLNPFGEPHWSVAARLEDPSNPPGSGWLGDDHQVKMVNDWTVTAPGEEPRQVHLQAVNPLAEPAKVVLGVDPSDFPSEWHYQLSPLAGDTLLFYPGESRTVTLTVQAHGTDHVTGTIHVFETLLPEANSSACSGCEDSACGGFIRETGGCAVTLIADLPVPVAVALVSAEADRDGVSLVWSASGDAGLATVYRSADAVGWVAIGSAAADGAGRIAFEDRDVVPGMRYGYRLGIPGESGETLVGEVWVDVPGAYTFSLDGVRPNPARRELSVRFSLPDASPATLELLDVAGRRVRRSEVGSLGPGNHVVTLGREASLPPGVYLVRLTQGARSLSFRGTVVR